MKNTSLVKLTAMAAIVALAGTAQAGFVNGGFETGTFAGWTLQNGYYNGGGLNGITWNANAAQASIVSNPTDYYMHTAAGSTPTPIAGSYMALLNDPGLVGGARVTKISQTATIDAADGSDLFINWGAVLDDPPGHSTAEEPFFAIDIMVNGTSVYSVLHRSGDGGWALSDKPGPRYGDPVYFKTDTFHLTGLTVGNSVTLSLISADCSPTAHGAYAYLDGIGSVYVPPVGVVPEPSTVLAGALLLLPFGATALRSFRKNKKA